MARRPRVLISTCLLGIPCRYDGQSKACADVAALMQLAELVPVCPEQLGGLPTPRLPSERRGDAVVARDGRDVTEAFRLGAACACRLAERFQARYAVLKARSPSCGSGEIYDGSFSGRRVPGSGVAAEALEAMGVAVYSEHRMNELIDILEREEYDTI